MSAEPAGAPFARAPKGKGVQWMRRIANIGFGLAAMYFVYLVAILVISARNNASFEGQQIGPLEVEFISGGTAGAAVDSVATVTNDEDLKKSQLFDGALRRKQVVVMWATWCGPCHSLLMDLKQDVVDGKLNPENIIAVSIAEPLRDVAAYLQKTPLPFRIALDREGSLARRVELAGTPTVMFLDADGVIRKVSTGGFGLPGKVSGFLK